MDIAHVKDVCVCMSLFQQCIFSPFYSYTFSLCLCYAGLVLLVVTLSLSLSVSQGKSWVWWDGHVSQSALGCSYKEISEET